MPQTGGHSDPSVFAGLKRARWLEALVARKREAHPELARPLTWARLRGVCAREGVHLSLADLPPEQPAQLLPFFARWTILVADDLAMRERVRLAAHELAHVWAHHDPEHERWEVVYHAVHPAPNDPAEREANAIAWLLLEGVADLPAASPRPVRRRARDVPPAFDPYTAPLTLTVDRRTPRYGGQEGETPLQRALRRVRPAPRPMAMDVPRSDAETVLYEPGGVVRYVDAEGRRWRVYDVAVVPTRQIVSLGSELARYRVFVNAIGVRRKYVFRSKWELRDVAARHFERQLREAVETRAVSATRAEQRA